MEQVASISGNNELGRFGMKLVTGWDDRGILIGAPYAGLGLDNYGKVFYFSGKSSLPSGDITSQCGSDLLPCTGKWAELMLTQQEPESLFGSNAAWEKADGEPTVLIVAAERSILGSRLGGSLYIYKPRNY